MLIASATPTHVDLIIGAVKAGKKVLCEKPIDLSVDRVDECWEQIKDLDPTVMLGFNRRFDPAFNGAMRDWRPVKSGTWSSWSSSPGTPLRPRGLHQGVRRHLSVT